MVCWQCQHSCVHCPLVVSKEKGKRKLLTAKNSTKKIVEEMEIVTKVGLSVCVFIFAYEREHSSGYFTLHGEHCPALCVSYSIL